MRDGTRLATDLYLPQRRRAGPGRPGTDPVRHTRQRCLVPGDRTAVRGQRHGLRRPGHARPPRQRGRARAVRARGTDGYDTCEWIVRQPWSDGTHRGIRRVLRRVHGDRRRVDAATRRSARRRCAPRPRTSKATGSAIRASSGWSSSSDGRLRRGPAATTSRPSSIGRPASAALRRARCRSRTAFRPSSTHGREALGLQASRAESTVGHP